MIYNHFYVNELTQENRSFPYIERLLLLTLFLLFWGIACIDIYQMGRDNPCDPGYQGDAPCHPDTADIDAEPDAFAPDQGEDIEAELDTALDEDAPFNDCEDVESGPDCSSVCSEGTAVCQDPGMISTCQRQENNCFEWQDAGPCGVDPYLQTIGCDKSLEVGVIETVCCQNECLSGTVQCEEPGVGRGLETCQKGGDECFELHHYANCGSDTVCDQSLRMCVQNDFLINSYPYQSQFFDQFQIGVLSNEQFVVVWKSLGQEGEALKTGIYGQIFSASGQKIGSEFRANTYTSNNQTYPQIGILDSNRFVVVWDSDGQDKSNFGIFGQRFYGNGSKYLPEFQVNQHTSGIQQYSQIAIFNPERFVVVWSSDSQDGDGNGIFAKIFQWNGVPFGSEFQVNVYTTSSQIDHQIKVFGDHRWIVVWDSLEQDHSFYGVYGRIFSSTGYGSAEFIINQYTTQVQFGPQIQGLDDKRFIVTWLSVIFHPETGQSNFRIAGRIYNSQGAPLTSEFLVNPTLSNDQRNVMVKPIAANRFLIGWDESRSFMGAVDTTWIRLLDSRGTPLTSALQVNSITLVSDTRSCIEVLKDNRFLVIWLSKTESPEEAVLYMSLFDSSANLLVPEFLVNSDPINFDYPPDPIVKEIAPSQFIIVWWSDSATAKGIWGKIFSPWPQLE